jgi:nucleoid DNA-binding protein
MLSKGMSTPMNKTELTRRLARAYRTSRAEAADTLDLTVLSILKRWKRGQAASFPGVGELKKGATSGITRREGAK